MMNEQLANVENIRFSPSKLRAAREAAFPGMSLRQFAKQVAKLRPAQISAYELGQYNPPPDALVRLCLLLNADLRTLTESSP